MPHYNYLWKYTSSLVYVCTMLTTKCAESHFRRCLMLQNVGRCIQEALKTLTGLPVNGLSMGRMLHCLLQFSLSNRSRMVSSKQWHTGLHENKLAASALRSKNSQVHLAPSGLFNLSKTPCCHHSHQVSSGTWWTRSFQRAKVPQSPIALPSPCWERELWLWLSGLVS